MMDFTSQLLSLVLFLANLPKTLELIQLNDNTRQLNDNTSAELKMNLGLKTIKIVLEKSYDG